MTRRSAAGLERLGAFAIGLMVGCTPACAISATLPWRCVGSQELAVGTVWESPTGIPSDHTSFEVVEEAGGDLQYISSDGVWRPVSFPGTRLGWWFRYGQAIEEGRVQWRSVATSAPVAGVLWKGCRWADPNYAAWFAQAQALAELVDPAVATNAVDIAAFDRLLAIAVHPFQRAAAAHLRANARYRANDYPGSAADFAEAAQQWLEFGDRARAGAAMLGQGDLLRLMGRHAESRQVSIEAMPLLDGPTTRHFLSRAHENVCHAHHYAGELDLAADCLNHLSQEYLLQGEIDALFNASVLLLAVRGDQGSRIDPQRLDPLLSSALDSPGVDPMRKGRLQLQVAMSLRAQGDVASSLRGFDSALGYFQQATEERERWVASTLLQVSGLYSELGMFEQAYAIHRDAVRGISARSAPARVGSALKWLAEIDRSAGDTGRAMSWAEKSIALYATLNMPAELAISRLVRMELRAELGLLDPNAESELALISSDLTQPYQVRAQLLASRLRLRSQGKLASIDQLDSLRQPTMPLRVQHEATLVAARALKGASRDREAVDALTSQMQRTARLSQSVGHPALAYLITRSLGGVRRELATSALARNLSQTTGEKLWEGLLDGQPLGKFRANTEARDSSLAFSAEVSRKLMFGEGPWSRSAETLLLGRLGGAKNATAQQRTPGLAEVQAGIRADDMLLVIVPAEPASLLWVIEAEAEQRIRIAGRRELELGVSDLLKQIGAHRAAGPGLDRAIVEVSRSFLGGLADRPVPSRMYVLFDESLGDVPWALLRWPGRTGPLIETTATSWISRIEYASDDAAGPVSAQGVDVLIANPEPQNTPGALASLPVSEMEAGLIVLKDRALRPEILDGERASPEQLRASLGRSDAIVHLAAHGFSKPGLLGYAGVWLAPKPGTTQPQFLSWLDVADTPLEAGLAVLNACQLAAGPSASNASSLSFAGAISAAGVDQVVAALWPVSDAATVKWVPAFYGALDVDDLGSSAEALRQAQLLLRSSRHFRHPYYWASLVHFRHLEVVR